MTAHLATTGNRKVHFEFSWQAGKAVCRSGDALVQRLATLDDNGGQEGAIATLTAANIAPSRLCRKCFGARLVHTYTAQRAA